MYKSDFTPAEESFLYSSTVLCSGPSPNFTIPTQPLSANEMEIYRGLEKLDHIQLIELIKGMAHDQTQLQNVKYYLESTEKEKNDTKTSNKKNWNEEFQQLLSTPDSLQKFQQLFHLAHDFVYAAGTYAKIIISEQALPIPQKTMKPASQMGGFAGGACVTKATDFEFKPGSWMYGGKQRSDANAMKAASHELKGLSSYYDCDIQGLHFPLMAVIDFKGYRVIAMSILPIDQTTLRYGSDDAGATVHADIPALNAIMKRTSELLNLKPHIVGFNKNNRVLLHAVGDLEGHLGFDNRLYLVDFGRTFPCEGPSPQIENRTERQEYYKMLRPELVRSWKERLCPDAFTNWQKYDPNSHQHNIEVYKATEYLKAVVVPKFAKKLDNSVKGAGRYKSEFWQNRAEFARRFAQIHKKTFDFTSDLKNIDAQEFSGPIRLIEDCHRHGINVRHLGLVRSFSQQEQIKRLLLVEMVARVIKDRIHSKMRERMEEIRVLSEEPFNKVIVEAFSYVCRSESATDWWKEIKDGVQRKFHKAFSPEEDRAPIKRLTTLFDKFSLLNRVLELVGIKLSDEAKKELQENPKTFHLVDSDILEVYAKIKHMNTVDYSEGMALSIMAHDTGDKRKRERLRLLIMSSEKFRLALRSSPSSFMALYQWALVLLHQAELSSTGQTEILLKSAVEKFKEAISLKPTFQDAHMKLGLTMLKHANFIVIQHEPTPMALTRAKRLYKDSREAYQIALDRSDNLTFSRNFHQIFELVQDLHFQSQTHSQINKKRSSTLYLAVLIMCPMLYSKIVANQNLFLEISEAEPPPQTIHIDKLYEEAINTQRIMDMIPDFSSSAPEGQLLTSTSPHELTEPAKTEELTKRGYHGIGDLSFNNCQKPATGYTSPSDLGLASKQTPKSRPPTTEKMGYDSPPAPGYEPLEIVKPDTPNGPDVALRQTPPELKPSGYDPLPQLSSASRLLEPKPHSPTPSPLPDSPGSGYESIDPRGIALEHYEESSKSYKSAYLDQEDTSIPFTDQTAPLLVSKENKPLVPRIPLEFPSYTSPATIIPKQRKFLQTTEQRDQYTEFFSQFGPGQVIPSGYEAYYMSEKDTVEPSKFVEMMAAVPNQIKNSMSGPTEAELLELCTTKEKLSQSQQPPANLAQLIKELGASEDGEKTLSPDDLVIRSKILDFQVLITDLFNVWSDSILEYACLKVKDKDYLPLFTEAAEKYGQMLKIFPDGIKELKNKARGLKEKAKEKFKVMFAAAECFRVISENSTPTCEVYSDWASCLISFASLYEGTPKFNELLSQAVEKLETGCKIDENMYNDRITQTLHKQRHELQMELTLSLLSPLLKSKLTQRIKNHKFLSFQKCFSFSDVLLNELSLMVADLTKLNLSHCYCITDKSLEIIQKNCPLIQKINLTKCNISDEGIKHLIPSKNLHILILNCCSQITNASFQFISKFPQIRKLDFSRCNIDNKGLFYFEDSPVCSLLESLSLRRCNKVHDAGLLSLSKHGLPSLTSLDVSGCSMITPEGLIFFTSKTPLLKRLSMDSAYRITDESLTTIFTTLPTMTDINLCNSKKIGKAGIEALSLLNSLKKVNLSRIPKMNTPGDSFALADVFQRHGATLQHIELEESPRLPLVILQTLANSVSMELTYLDLSFIDAVNDNIMSQILENSHNLKHLKLRKCVQVTDSTPCLVSKCSSIETLDFSFCRRITDVGVIEIAKLNSLRHLDLSHNSNLSSNGVIEIAMRLRLLKHLNIGFCTKVQTDAVIMIARNMNILSLLVLESCTRITDKAVFQLARHSQTLKKLNLSGCVCLNSDSIISLAEGVPTLRYLHLRSLPKVNDFVVQKIAASLPQLILLDLQGCSNITEQAPLHFKSKLVKPQVLLSNTLIHELARGIKVSAKDVLKTRDGLRRVEERPSRVFSPSNPELIQMVTKMQDTIQRRAAEGGDIDETIFREKQKKREEEEAKKLTEPEDVSVSSIKTTINRFKDAGLSLHWKKNALRDSPRNPTPLPVEFMTEEEMLEVAIANSLRDQALVGTQTVILDSAAVLPPTQHPPKQINDQNSTQELAPGSTPSVSGLGGTDTEQKLPDRNPTRNI